ncbi:hypothetical protein NUW58_g4117 [Xylaria curta]|uniref:Uncharacterized protein n=1 Tax=Xylaria curta TaxID=42375 RepID=A0ACC1P942_9PEZI|nr:hypothetical protein NUW58_g4117 [Xylaria curta]
MPRNYFNMRYVPQTGGVYATTSIVTASPRSFIYYIVADVRPTNSHWPLAVTLRQATSLDPNPRFAGQCTEDRVRQVLEDCMRIVNILTEPSNRTALEAELGLAANWYQGPNYRAPARVEVPDRQQPGVHFSWKNSKEQVPELPWPCGIREFPFISTCLRPALNPRGTRVGHVQEQPLGTLFRDDRLEYGMVVLDISDLSQVRYGIVSFAVKYMCEVDVSQVGDWDHVEGQPPERDPVPTLEERRSRVPLTSVKLMRKYMRGISLLGESFQALSRIRVVSSATLKYIWPAKGVPSNDFQDYSTGPSNSPGNPKYIDGLDQAIENLMQGTAHSEDFDISSIRQSVLHPEFQTRLLSRLLKAPLSLGASKSSMQLLQLAYAGHSHLNWVTYGNLNYEGVAAALQSDQLKECKALSLCIDHLGGSPDALFDALLHLKSIREINFFQQPARENDELGSRLFAQICASSSGPSLLRERNILLTCAYSAPLQRKVWLPDIESRRLHRVLNWTPPVHAFPVQHMFAHQQFVGLGDSTTFRPCYFFLGDALLNPERFATGFLKYCCSVLTDGDMFSFACSPPTLLMYKEKSPGMRISPIASENFAVPRRWDVASIVNGSPSGKQVECWPMVRDFEPGGWTVLVSHEWYVSPEVDRGKPRPDLGYDTEVPFIRYAFIRTRRHINVNDATNNSASPLEEIVGPNYVEVVGGLVDLLFFVYVNYLKSSPTFL